MRRLALGLALIVALPAVTHAEAFRFSVLMRVMDQSQDESAIRSALQSAQASEPAFIVVNGFKRSGERCSEALFQQRKQLLAQVTVPVISSIAATDWASCRDRQKRPAALVWLNFLRDQFAGDISSNSTTSLNIKHQSSMRAYRSYAENTRWVYDRILFASLHVAANNNQYIEAAGRNQEFEDRQVANREWLRRLADVALRERRGAIVIFCDGNPLPGSSTRSEERDGYREVRKQLRELAEKTGLWVLVVQGTPSDAPRTSPDILWTDRLGYVTLPVGVSILTADLNAALPFALTNHEP